MAFKKAVCCVLLCVLLILVPSKSETFSERASTEEELLLMTGDGCESCNKGCPNSDISFYLYTRDTQDSPYLLDPSNPDTITNANFVEGVPLKVIIHGYTGHKDFSPNVELRPALVISQPESHTSSGSPSVGNQFNVKLRTLSRLGHGSNSYFEKGEHNIISVDWGNLAQAPCYTESALNVYTVAECAAEFLDTLYQTRSELDVNNTHIIGFSLGAHVAGLMGSNLKTGNVSRVTGLDPAMPLFDDLTKSREEMINSDVAQFVDVYHSNAGFEGKKAACGLVDVFFNYGTSQPGCNCTSSCDHKRSVQYFAESINSAVGLWGFACDECDSFANGTCTVTSADELIILGDSISTSMDSGSYIIVTNSASPFLLEPSVYIEQISKVESSCTRTEYLLNMG